MGADNSTPATHQWNRNTIIEWTEEGATKLLREIKQKNKNRALNILFFGPSGCGKSSLCNGIITALTMDKDVAKMFAVGKGQDVSYTKNFQFTRWENITLYDMAGVFESSSITSQRILNIVQGNVSFTGKLDDFLNQEKESKSQEQGKPVSCVVLVLRPGMELAVNLKRIIRQIDRSAGEGSLAYHMVLTHLDEEEDCFKDPKNLNRLLTSPQVQESVKIMSEVVGIPPNAISFVRNHVYESHSDIKSKVLFLHTFKQIVHAACQLEEKRAMFAAAK